MQEAQPLCWVFITRGMCVKRDLGAIRFILQKLEDVVDSSVALALPDLVDAYADFAGDTPENRRALVGSFRLLLSEKFIVSDRATWNTPEGPKAWDSLKGITWRGYNLIDAIDQDRPLDTI
ncbi:hypothetical protein [Pseudomonas protegens]|uniref:hypothetical protein n=1 Tax=Pseudomonas protegens TaxID=380021 RepID=UPI0011B6947F|nr:hypothetical protein [Pseudomonas protegens]